MNKEVNATKHPGAPKKGVNKKKKKKKVDFQEKPQPAPKQSTSENDDTEHDGIWGSATEKPGEEDLTQRKCESMNCGTVIEELVDTSEWMIGGNCHPMLHFGQDEYPFIIPSNLVSLVLTYLYMITSNLRLQVRQGYTTPNRQERRAHEPISTNTNSHLREADESNHPAPPCRQNRRKHNKGKDIVQKQGDREKEQEPQQEKDKGQEQEQDTSGATATCMTAEAAAESPSDLQVSAAPVPFVFTPPTTVQVPASSLPASTPAEISPFAFMLAGVSQSTTPTLPIEPPASPKTTSNVFKSIVANIQSKMPSFSFSKAKSTPVAHPTDTTATKPAAPGASLFGTVSATTAFTSSPSKACPTLFSFGTSATTMILFPSTAPLVTSAPAASSVTLFGAKPRPPTSTPLFGTGAVPSPTLTAAPMFKVPIYFPAAVSAPTTSVPVLGAKSLPMTTAPLFGTGFATASARVKTSLFGGPSTFTSTPTYGAPWTSTMMVPTLKAKTAPQLGGTAVVPVAPMVLSASPAATTLPQGPAIVSSATTMVPSATLWIGVAARSTTLNHAGATNPPTFSSVGSAGSAPGYGEPTSTTASGMRTRRDMGPPPGQIGQASSRGEEENNAESIEMDTVFERPMPTDRKIAKMRPKGHLLATLKEIPSNRRIAKMRPLPRTISDMPLTNIPIPAPPAAGFTSRTAHTFGSNTQPPFGFGPNPSPMTSTVAGSSTYLNTFTFGSTTGCEDTDMDLS
ncbi:hypothetical protein BGX29_004465 [Mortierella sp. GBA35]|nr:hypothetical protein BGX29_004465 [Mortierella sp. GBA35]